MGQSKLRYWILADPTSKENNCSTVITQLLNYFLHCQFDTYLGCHVMGKNGYVIFIEGMVIYMGIITGTSRSSCVLAY